MECKARLDCMQIKLAQSYKDGSFESFLESQNHTNPDLMSQPMDYELAFRGLLDDIISEVNVEEVIMRSTLLFRL